MSEVRADERTHALEADSIGALWAGMRRSLAWLEQRTGQTAFAHPAAHIEQRLSESYHGALRVEMPAWLALGIKT